MDELNLDTTDVKLEGDKDVGYTVKVTSTQELTLTQEGLLQEKLKLQEAARTIRSQLQTVNELLGHFDKKGKK